MEYCPARLYRQQMDGNRSQFYTHVAMKVILTHEFNDLELVNTFGNLAYIVIKLKIQKYDFCSYLV